MFGYMYSKTASEKLWDGSFEYPQHVKNIMGKKYLQMYAEIMFI